MAINFAQQSTIRSQLSETRYLQMLAAGVLVYAQQDQHFASELAQLTKQASSADSIVPDVPGRVLLLLPANTQSARARAVSPVLNSGVLSAFWKLSPVS